MYPLGLYRVCRHCGYLVNSNPSINPRVCNHVRLRWASALCQQLLYGGYSGRLLWCGLGIDRDAKISSENSYDEPLV